MQYALEVYLSPSVSPITALRPSSCGGFTDWSKFTFEFPIHMMSRVARLYVDSGNCVIMHCHPVNLPTKIYVHELGERVFTRSALWQMHTEYIAAFPDGINVLPWTPCGTN